MKQLPEWYANELHARFCELLPRPLNEPHPLDGFTTEELEAEVARRHAMVREKREREESIERAEASEAYAARLKARWQRCIRRWGSKHTSGTHK
jgi:hypothetical protein